MQVMNREQFDSWFEENIQKWIEVQVGNARSDPYMNIEEEHDEVGVLAASDMFHMIASFLSEMDDVLHGFDHEISLSRAYGLLSYGVGWGMDNGVLGGDWGAVQDLFDQREGEFAEAPLEKIPYLSDDLYRWVSCLDRIMWAWKLKTDAYSRDGDFDDADKILLIRSTLLMLRNLGYFQYKGWFKELIASLDTDWRVMGGGWTPSIPPGYDPPWSHGGK